MSTWADVEKGAIIELAGKAWTVTRYRPHGKKVDVRVERKGVRHEATVKLSAPVKLVVPPKPKLVEPDRWSTPEEHDAALSLPPGEAQRNVEKILGARLIGTQSGEGEEWYVPPVDVTTVAAHLVIFHGLNDPSDISEAAMLTAHSTMHAQADRGELFLHVPHRHTEKA